jgi:hypothetical protein
LPPPAECRSCRAPLDGAEAVQNWAGDIIAILRDAHAAVEAARGDTALDQKALDDLRERYDTAVRSGIIHLTSQRADAACPGGKGCSGHAASDRFTGRKLLRS